MELERIGAKIDYYRSKGCDAVAESLEARREELEMLVNEPKGKRQRLAVNQEEDRSTDDFNMDTTAQTSSTPPRSPRRVPTPPPTPPPEEPFFSPNRPPKRPRIEKLLAFRTNVTLDELIGGLLILKTFHKITWTVFLSIIGFVQALLVTNCLQLPKDHKELKAFFDDLHGIPTERVVYCTVCKCVCSKSEGMKKPKEVYCNNDGCNRDLSEDVKKGIGTFINIPVIPQLRSYVEKSGSLVKNVENFMSIKFLLINLCWQVCTNSLKASKEQLATTFEEKSSKECSTEETYQ